MYRLLIHYLLSIIFSAILTFAEPLGKEDDRLDRSIVKEFHKVDTSNNGYVSIEEVLEYWREYTKKMNEAELDVIREAFTQADTDKDKKVNLAEFTAEVHRVLADPEFPRKTIEKGILAPKYTLFKVNHKESSKNHHSRNVTKQHNSS
ncbi:unnamed protein product [Cylicocyclus nassatus]|uniref:EF-hand domain-containing protein n=1 Tax=Cylicocyclus nassatus TaxID=53992 RepID=A0AA36DNA0_CYLNA|nr:unnamed protein product [Cylicocyclus nassatus]